ncbi:hypothetical protein FRC07_012356 [Ceratobasidium sp. 392]|nr:hypothetical protein FRC07_012356 [Ceratobasidium sp. 392]
MAFPILTDNDSPAYTKAIQYRPLNLRNSGSSILDLSLHPEFLPRSTQIFESKPIGTPRINKPQLVAPDQIRAHLIFLGAIHTLKHTIQSPNLTSSSDEVWATYVARAVDRFAAWTNTVVRSLGHEKRHLKEEEIPPLDVLMAEAFIK